MYYKLRVDTDDKSKLKELLLKYCKTYIIAQEDSGDNKHCHCYLESITKPGTIRASIRKKYGSGNGVYSLGLLDDRYPIEYIAYIIKEDPNYICDKIPLGILEKAKVYDMTVKKKLSKKKMTILQNLNSFLKEKLVKKDMCYYYGAEPNFYMCKPEYIVDAVLDYYTKDDRLIREFMIVSLCQTLCLRYCNGYTSDYRSRLLSKIIF